MDTLEFIKNRFNLNLDQKGPIQIPGSRWHELGPLLNDLGCKKAVEVGVYKARFTKTLAQQCPNMNILGVDAWKVYGNYKDYENDDLEKTAYQDAIRRTKDYKNVLLQPDWSVDAANKIEDESLDYIFIDANHQYEYVVEDMKAWIPKVKTGGIIMGHDYFRYNKLKFGVIQAVNGWVETHRVNHLFVWRDQCPSWMFIKGDENL